jgi:outer membrane immunogenic protein
MRRLFTAIVAAGMSLAASGFAAAAGTPVLSWTGFYAGGNLGYGLGQSNSDTNLTGLGVGRFAFAHSDPLNLDGVLGGAQIGYNWQVSPNWVYGLEADFQGSGISATQTYSDAYSGSGGLLGVTATGTGNTSYDASISWFSTARGRVGYALNRLLIYGTGGLAYGEVRVGGTLMDSGTTLILCGPSCTPTPFSGSGSFNASSVNVGWTLGAGVEGALVDRWTWKAEYLYVDLGSLNLSAAGPTPSTVNVHAHFADNILRVGFNYKFGN